MIAHYRVPLEGVGLERVKAAVEARNRVVHSGLYKKKKESDPALRQHVAVLREFLVRIFLKHLGYKGQYWSLLGADWRNFPSEST